MAFLTKEQILGAKDREPVVVSVPEWGGDVRLTAMSAAERDAFETSMMGKGDNVKKLANFRARFVARCIVDDDGNRLFADADIVELGKRSGAVLGRVFDEARKVNGMTQADVEELEGE